MSGLSSALTADCEFPENVNGAREFGISVHDFHRLNDHPGKTLVVGSTPEGLEIAGILACCRNPVTVISKSKILEVYDAEIVKMIVDDLKDRGVRFIEDITLTDLEVSQNNNIIAKCFVGENSLEEEFDTVIFAVGSTIGVDYLNLVQAGFQLDPIQQKFITDEYEMTTVPNICAVGECVAYRPDNVEVAELAGTLLAKRLFDEGTELMDYSMCPTVMFTPIEYAYVGLSEESAFYRLGEECIVIYKGSFVPLDFELPPKKGECFAKIIVLKLKDLVIGLHLFGPDAGEIIQGFVAAIKAGLTMSQLRSVSGVPTTIAQHILKLNYQTEPITEISEILELP